MPFAGFQNFDDCVRSMQEKQNYDLETAKKVCGKLKAEHEKKTDSLSDEKRKQDQAEASTDCPEGQHFDKSEGRCVPDEEAPKTDSITVVPDVLPKPEQKQDSKAPENVWKQKYDCLSKKFNRLLDSLLANVFEQRHLDSMNAEQKLAAYEAAVAVQRKIKEKLPKQDSLVPEPAQEAPPTRSKDAEDVQPFVYDYGIRGTLEKNAFITGGKRA